MIDTSLNKSLVPVSVFKSYDIKNLGSSTSSIPNTIINNKKVDVSSQSEHLLASTGIDSFDLSSIYKPIEFRSAEKTLQAHILINDKEGFSYLRHKDIKVCCYMPGTPSNIIQNYLIDLYEAEIKSKIEKLKYVN